MSTLRYTNVVWTKNQRTIISKTSLCFAEGKINLLLGSNGAGKTSLFRLGAFLEKPSWGKVDIVGGEKKASRKEVSMVFQRPVLFSRSIWENLAYPLKLRRLRKKDIDQRLEEVLSLVHMESMAFQPAGSLSAGEAQKVALARAFVLRPKVFLVDEPVANLDPSSRALCESLLQSMCKNFGTTLALITHDMQQAQRIGEIVYYMDQGWVGEPLPVKDFFQTPPSKNAEAYIHGKNP